jgi:molecular chaperone DnaK
VEVGDGVFEVINTCGDAHLGGDNFDKTLVDGMDTTFEKEVDINLRHGTQPFRESRKQVKSKD